MGIVSTVGGFFRNLSDGWEKINHRLDPYKLHQPIVNAITHTEATHKALSDEVASNFMLFGFINLTPGKIKRNSEAGKAYNTMISQLPTVYRAQEGKKALNGVIAALDAVLTNLRAIEVDFNQLFGGTLGEDRILEIRTSTLMALGYIEQVNTTNQFIGTLIESMTATHAELVPPYWLKTMNQEAKQVGEFLSLNLDRWYPKHGGLIGDIKNLQKKGSDVLVQTGSTYIDDYIHDNAFSDGQGTLMNAALRNPFLMFASGQTAREAAKIELYIARKDWLVSKVAVAEAKLRGETENSLEYQRLEKVASNYMDLVNKYEQKIERMRA